MRLDFNFQEKYFYNPHCMKIAILSFDKRIVGIIITFLDIKLKIKILEILFRKIVEKSYPPKSILLTRITKNA